MGEGGGTNTCQKFCWVSLCLQKHSDWMSCTGLKCLNTNFICYATQLVGGGGFFFNSEFDLFFWDDLHLQIIASISPKASVENSSAQIIYLFHAFLDNNLQDCSLVVSK